MADVNVTRVQVSFQSPAIRWAILCAYWLVILFALPLWWSTTSIKRLSLPATHVRALSSAELRFPVHVQLDVSSTAADSTWLAREVQGLVNAQLQKADYGHHNLEVHIEPFRDTKAPLDSDSYLVKIDSGAQAFSIKDRQLICTKDALSPSTLANMLIALLTPYSSGAIDRQRVAKYAPRYRLAFSLLNEDAAQGPAVSGWDIDKSHARLLSPTLHGLNVLHNFTLESQVQFHAPLAFAPRTVAIDSSTVYGLTAEDLTVFVNSAEWTLSSSASDDPVLHFVLFVPSASRRPLHILDTFGSPTNSDAFILPQWGGIVVYNPPSDFSSHIHMTSPDLENIMTTFKYQLLSLLGVPELPQGVISSEWSASPSDWQLDVLLRRRALENVQDSAETLQSIVKLVDQIKNMPVKEDVRGDIQDALLASDMTFEAASKSAELALLHSSRALTLSSRAFFNPGMLALLYFPPEHTYAVYAPLFAPISLPLIAPVVRELLSWRKDRKRRKARGSIRQKVE